PVNLESSHQVLGGTDESERRGGQTTPRHHPTPNYTTLRDVTCFRPYLAYSIWVATPREVRVQRRLERDGADAMTQWKRWMEAEDQYIGRERPEEGADLVIRGDKNLWAT